jgi:hypothetical protein
VSLYEVPLEELLLELLVGSNVVCCRVNFDLLCEHCLEKLEFLLLSP